MCTSTWKHQILDKQLSSGIAAVISETDFELPHYNSEPFHPDYFDPFCTIMAPPEANVANVGNPKGHRTPEAYDGKVPEDYPQWVARFEMIAKANKWGEGDALLGVFPIYLKDHAFNLFTTLADTEKDTYDHMKAAMKRALGIGENSLSWRLQLRQAKRLPNESMDGFAFRLAKLADQAYPDDDAPAQERNVVEQFILGQKPELARYLLQDRTDSLIDLKDKAKRFETAQELAGGARGVYCVETKDSEASASAINSVNAESDRSNETVLRAALNLITSGATNFNWGPAGMGSTSRPVPAPHRCFKCNKTGHLAAQCRAKSQSGGPAGLCFNCNQPGHLKKDCPQRGNSNQVQLQFPRLNIGTTCFQCGNFGHRAADCRTDVSKICSYCEKKGHLEGDCRMKRTHGRYASAGPATNATVSKNDTTQAEMGPTWG